MIIKYYKPMGFEDYTASELENIKENSLIKSCKKFNVANKVDEIKDYISNIEKPKKDFETINDNSEERIVLRKKIVDEYLARFESEKKNKKANIVIGQIASGKSTLSKDLQSETGAMLVDSDIIKQGCGDFEGLRKDFDNGLGVRRVHEEASELQREIYARALDRGDNIVLPRVAKNFKSFYFRDILPLLKNGYSLDLSYIDVGLEDSTRRNYERFLADYCKGAPARLVPFDVIIKDIGDNPLRSFCTIKAMKKGCNPSIVDNMFAYSSVGKGSSESFDKVDLETMKCKYYTTEGR